MLYKLLLGLGALSAILFFVFKSNTAFSSEPTVVEKMEKQDVTDGPYLFIQDDHIIEKRIVKGQLMESTYPADSSQLHVPVQPSEVITTSKIAALSDIHGQYDLAVTLFKNNGIIDDSLNWAFGEGHLVIVGDIMDRGDKTTEVLWLIYRLEQEAKAAGGALHFTMGNHEYMALRGDLRYIHAKYVAASEILGTTYDELFNDQTVLGRWLRSKPTILRVNDMVFVHGGISEMFLTDSINLDALNNTYRETFDIDKETVKASPVYSKFHNRDCPVWYRGYFGDEAITESEVDQILATLHTNHIIVGHTSQSEILRMYNGKVYCVDSSIKNGEYGEILFIDRETFSKHSLNGEQLAF